jgi:hypothetical protein
VAGALPLGRWIVREPRSFVATVHVLGALAVAAWRTRTARGAPAPAPVAA